jgi:hypothetical protein
MARPRRRDLYDLDGPREPYPMARSDAESTPVRSPIGLLVIGVVVQVLTIALTVWAAMAYAAGKGGNLQLWQLVLLGVVLVVAPMPLVWIGAARTRWWLRYRSATGQSPEPWSG